MFKKILIIGDSWGVPNYYGKPGIDYKYHTEYLLKEQGHQIINCAINNGSNIESIEKAFEYLNNKIISTRPDIDTKTINDGKPIDLIIWFHTDLLRDYDRFTPDEKIETALEKIANITYDFFTSLIKRCDCMVALIGGLSPVRKEMYKYFQADFFIEDWKSELLKISVPKIQSFSRLDTVEKSPDDKTYKIDLLDKHKQVSLALESNKEYFPDGCHPGIVPHRILAYKILNFLEKNENLSKEDFLIELPSLKFDKTLLKKTLDDIKLWIPAYAPSEKLFISEQNFDFNLILSQLKKEFPTLKTKAVFFIKLPAKTTVEPHIDINYQTAALLIPVEGNMEKSPLLFHKKNSKLEEHIAYKHVYSHPVIFNTTFWHSSYNHSETDRYLLRINLVNKDWESVKQIVKDSGLNVN